MGRKVSTAVYEINETGKEVPKTKGMNSLLFVNRGTATAYVNNWPIPYGEKYTIGLDEGDELSDTYKIVFDPTGTTSLFVCIGYYPNL